MAYADEETGNRRLIAFGIVAALHAAAGYGIAKIGINGAKQLLEDLKTFDVAEEIPEEAEKPPPPPEKLDIPPPPKVTAPPPIVQSPIVSSNTQAVTITPSAPPAPPPPPPAPPPPPGPPKVAQRAVQKGGSISDEDYPSSAVRAEEAGTSVATFTIGPDGKVGSCNANGAGGTLDAETCRLIIRRFRYKPALDAGGSPMSETKTQRVTWRLPK